MSGLAKENQTQEEKLLLWRQKREGRLRIGEGKSSTERRRPVLRPLPNRRTTNQTPQSSKPDSSRTSVSKETPFSHQSSVTPSESSGNSRFLHPTASSARKSVGNLSRKPRTALCGGKGSSATSLRRISHGVLSKPPVRAQRDSSVSSSFLQLSDTQQFDCTDACEETVQISAIHLASPRLPNISPLPFFSPSDRTHSGSKKGRDDQARSTINPRKVHFIEGKSTSPRKTREKTREHISLEYSHNPLKDEVGHEADDKHPQVTKKSIMESDHVPESLSSRMPQKEYPALDAALHEFSTLNISFNLDFSSDDDDSFQDHLVYRSSRDRSKGLGPILPIPSLRNDMDGNQTSCEPRNISNETNQSSSQSTSPKGKSSEIPRSCLPDKIQSPSIPHSQGNLDLLLPIPSLRDDSPDENEVLLRRRRQSLLLKRVPQSDTESLTSPDGNAASNDHNDQLPPLIVEIEDDDEALNRTSRNRGNTGLILPIPSLRDDPSCTPTSQNDVAGVSTPCHRVVTEQIDEPRLLPDQSEEQSKIDHQDTKRKSIEIEESYQNLVNQSSGKSQREEEEALGPEGCSTWIDCIPLVKSNDRHVLTYIPEENVNISTTETLQSQLKQSLEENKKLSLRLERYHRTYEDRVTPYRDIFEEWRKSKQHWKATEAQHQRLVQEVQEKFSEALQLSFRKCQELQAQLESANTRIKELEENQ